MKKLIALTLLVAGVLACQSPKQQTAESGFQTMSFLGDSLFIPSHTAEAEAKLKAHIDAAQSAFDSAATELNYVWLGRRWAYTGDYLKAIEIYTDGLERFPASYKLLRHRGHRYVSLRKLDLAIADFKKAYELMPKEQMETEPDGLPNKRNMPLSNTQFNILYHWGLAHYLKGEFDEAERVYQLCMDYSKNNDLLIATADWLYMTRKRLGKDEEAKTVLALITADMEIIENSSYHKRLLMYKGELPIDSLFSSSDADVQLSLTTQGYGVANWYLYNQDTLNAISLYRKILESPSWSPFGYIAAESDLANFVE